jgi:hypothetical protein
VHELVSVSRLHVFFLPTATIFLGTTHWMCPTGSWQFSLYSVLTYLIHSQHVSWNVLTTLLFCWNSLMLFKLPITWFENVFLHQNIPKKSQWVSNSVKTKTVDLIVCQRNSRRQGGGGLEVICVSPEWDRCHRYSINIYWLKVKFGTMNHLKRDTGIKFYDKELLQADFCVFVCEHWHTCTHMTYGRHVSNNCVIGKF